MHSTEIHTSLKALVLFLDVSTKQDLDLLRGIVIDPITT